MDVETGGGIEASEEERNAVMGSRVLARERVQLQLSPGSVASNALWIACELKFTAETEYHV